MKPKIAIAGRAIGPEHRPYVIAELSANHNGSIDKAFEIMQAAKDAGADAVKLQTYRADTITINHNGPEFLLREGAWAGMSLYQLYEEAHLPWEWHEALFEKGKELGVTVFSSPFDFTAVDFLEQFDPPAYKIASFELVDLPLIEYVASTGKPMIMSTGMAARDEVSEAVLAARRGGCKELSLLHCTSGYPTPHSEADLLSLPELARCFPGVVGLSDHTMGTTVAVAAVALGASVVEKHVTMRRSDGGPDSSFSLEPDELQTLVKDVGIAWEALGTVRKSQQDSEKTQSGLRRSIYAVQDIKGGEVLTQRNVRSIRPGNGLPPRELPVVIGCRASQDISRGTPLSWDLINEP